MFGRILIVSVSVLLVAGCRSSGDSEDSKEATAPDHISPERLQLEDLTARIATSFERAADVVAVEQTDPLILRNAIHWKMRMIPMARRALRIADDEGALMDLWLLAVRSVAYFRDDDEGKLLFGDSTLAALEASLEIEESARALGKALLTEEEFKAADDALKQYVAAQGENIRITTPVSSAAWSSTISGVLGKSISTLTKPLGYVDLTSGLNETAAAAYRVAAALDRTRTDFNYMPDQLRWQIELLLLELQENAMLVGAVDSWVKMGDASVEFAATAKALPVELRTELTSFVNDFDQKQANLQNTVRDLDAALVGVEKIVVSTDETAKSLTTMADAYERLTVAVSAFMTQVDPPDDPNAPPEPKPEPVEGELKAPPFNINDYGTTAEKLSETASNLTALLIELQSVTASDNSAVLLDNTEALVRAATNQLLLKGSLFVLVIALVALGYRTVVRKHA